MTDEGPETNEWVLAVDTSTEEAGLAISDGRVMAELNWTASRDQTVTVLDQIDRLLGLMGIEPAGLAAVVVATGPGMFNGLRVGMSVAKGLVIGLGLPLIGVSTLEATALPYRVAGLPVIPVVAAGRGRLVWAVFEPAHGGGFVREEEARNGTGQELADRIAARAGEVVICGELTAEQVAALARLPSVRLPARLVRQRRAAAVLELGRARFARGETDDPVRLEPLYLHAAGSAV